MEKQTIVKDKPVRLIKLFHTMADIYNDCILYGVSPTEEHIKKAISIKEQWSGLFADDKHLDPNYFSSLENVISAGLTNTKKGSDLIKAFFNLINKTVFTELNNWLNIYIYIYSDKELLEELFKLCSDAPSTNASAVFMVELISKIRFDSEQEKFDFLMDIVKKYPLAFSGECLPHSQYKYTPSPQRVFDKCPICGGKGEPYHCSFSYRMAHFDNPFEPFKLWMKCESCHNLYTKRFPEEFLAQSDHQKEITPGENSETAVSNIANGGKLSIWSDILNKLKEFSDKKSLLEVGIGNGELLSVALEMGYDANAVEIVEESAQKVSDILGIPIHCGDFLTFETEKTYSIIIMGDVIEHVTDPEAALRKAHELLEDDGVLWLSTPNFESSFTRLKKFTDAMWLEPYHISYFNYSGLSVLLEKCGFSVREYKVSNRYNGSMELIITKK